MLARLQLRWRIWRRDVGLMQMIARNALMRTGVCDESDSLIRIAWDRETGHLIVMIYLAHFDHAAWALSRHIEGYLIRQFKGLYGISVHSVHVDVIRSRAFKEMPPIKSASSLRAILRQRRGEPIKSTGITGRKIVHSQPARDEDDPFPATSHMGLEESSTAAKPKPAPVPDPSLSRTRSPKVTSPLITDEYLSETGYEISEVNFDEFLNSMPPESAMPPGVADSRQPRPTLGPTGMQAPKPGAAFVAEADLMKQERK